MTRILLHWFLCAAAAASAQPQWHSTLPEALSAAQSSGTFVLADFQAPWCYSCYYMEEKVLSKPAFAQAAQGLVLLKLDVDQPQGRSLKESFGVTFLPSYLLLDAKGKPLGRIVGEQTEADFLARLSVLRHGAGSDKADLALADLRASVAAGQYESALKEARSLPTLRLKTLELNAEWRILTLRASLMAAVRAKRPGGHEPLLQLLELDRSCDVAYDVGYAEEMVETLYPESRQSLLRAEQAALERLLEDRVFVEGPARCADMRSSIEALLSVYGRLDEKPKRAALLARALAFLEKAGKPGEDRNRDDNYRFFLEADGQDVRLRAFYEELVAAYPSDYVYAFRYAKYLAEKEAFGPALTWAEKADKLAYGANRLSVTKVRAKALASLGRVEDAKKLLKRDIRVAPAAFSKEVKSLEALLEELKQP